MAPVSMRSMFIEVASEDEDEPLTSEAYESEDEKEHSAGPSKMSTAQGIPFINDLWRSFMVNNLDPKELDLRRPGEYGDGSSDPASATANVLVWRRSNMRVLVVLLVLSIGFKAAAFISRLQEVQEMEVGDRIENICLEVCNQSLPGLDVALSTCHKLSAVTGKMPEENRQESLSDEIVSKAKDLATQQLQAHPHYKNLQGNITFAVDTIMQICDGAKNASLAGYCDSRTELEKLMGDQSPTMVGMSEDARSKLSEHLGEMTALLELFEPFCSGSNNVKATCSQLEGVCSKDISKSNNLEDCAAYAFDRFGTLGMEAILDSAQQVVASGDLGNVTLSLEQMAQTCFKLFEKLDGSEGCPGACKATIFEYVDNKVPGPPKTYEERAEMFNRYHSAQTFLSAYDVMIEFFTFCFAVPAAMGWADFNASGRALSRGFYVKVFAPFLITFLPVYSIFGVGPVASLDPQLLLYRFSLGMQIYQSITGVFVSLIPTVGYAAWLMVSLIPSSGLWPMLLFVTPFLNLVVIWPASILITQFIGDWGCAIGFALTSLAFFLYYPAAWVLLGEVDDAKKAYEVISRWHSRSFNTRMAGYLVIGFYGFSVMMTLKSEYFPEKEGGNPIELLSSFVTWDYFNSMVVVPYVIYYLCIIAYLDASIRVCTMLRRRDGYLASDPILSELCDLVHGEHSKVYSNGKLPLE
eukprot:gnl/MRDRNA2_/MRDRNA2_19846_c0_seq1.p1 gnl/MRDRNA2_/MRDRNA2_19846_c0~~gnl/MRDRNA2_/MRDRNA2_19846_c0_seq1.p1  ORF type:complete len:694 (-),score=110.99 gnl/MRDRNA2_/MRDRNA2_19846_c0_seq1:218-2299(-)